MISKMIYRSEPIFRSTQIPSPQEIKERPAPLIVSRGRQEFIKVLTNVSQKLVIILGPCSIHDTESALEYGNRLARLQKNIGDSFLLIMRVYLEKPRTALGWKGFILEPPPIDRIDPVAGIRKSRELLIQLSEMGILIAMEFLTPYLPLYLGDLVTWGCIGARTSASPTHRQLASSLDMPCGFKNSIDGSVESSITGIWVASKPDRFLGIDETGRPALIESAGNPYCHLVVRGGEKGPNYFQENILTYQRMLRQKGLSDKVLIDCSHDNSGKDFTKQGLVFREALGDPSLFGLMLESHLFKGRQSQGEGDLDYGVSLTDGCIGWDETEDLLWEAAEKRQKLVGSICCR